jgi:uncharacterized protein (TIGR00730 family)
LSKIITSFGSSLINTEEPLYSEIIEIGRQIALSGWSVCSGGYAGTMEAVSKGVKEAGGKTIGVCVKDWNKAPNKWLDEEIKAENLMERIIHLITSADAYVVFKGGTGTLVEISFTLEMMNKGAMKEKPMIFYTDFWRNVMEILKQDSDRLEEIIDRNVKYIKKPKEINNFL